MAKNFIEPGNTLTIPAPAGVLSSDVVIAGEIVGIAQGDAAAGEPCDVTTVGVWELPKVAADAVAVGDPVHWDETAALATTEAEGNPRLGTAVAAAASGTATVAVRLIG